MDLILDDTDLQEAINTANAIGDNHLQKQSSGRVVPGSFPHGTSAQLMRWLKKDLILKISIKGILLM